MKIYWVLLGLFVCSIAMAAPVANVVVRVVDRNGIPLENARVSVTFEPIYGKGLVNQNGLTDSNGLFSAQGESIPHVPFVAEKEGYYKSGDAFFLKGINGNKTRYEPWGAEQTLTLRKIIDPKKGIYGSTHSGKLGLGLDIPVFDKLVGFDVLESDWVAPYGKGKVSDFVFTFSKDPKQKTLSYILTFSNKGDGIVEYPFSKKSQSIFRWPYKAPLGGYGTSMKKSLIYERSSAFIPVNEEMKMDTEINYIFRVRTQYDEKGNIKSALYGKIPWELGMWPRPKVQLRFNYWLNTDPHSRSLESTDPYSP